MTLCFWLPGNGRSSPLSMAWRCRIPMIRGSLDGLHLSPVGMAGVT